MKNIANFMSPDYTAVFAEDCEERAVAKVAVGRFTTVWAQSGVSDAAR